MQYNSKEINLTY